MTMQRNDEGIFGYEDVFGRLDAYLNEATEEEIQQFRADLVGVANGSTAPNPGPFAGDRGTRDHWLNDWIDPSNHGGRFWSYLDEINIYELLTTGLRSSIGLIQSTGKRHLTIWLPIQDPPPAGQDVPLPDQQRLFAVGVHESDDEVQLVIVTPTPAKV